MENMKKGFRQFRKMVSSLGYEMAMTSVKNRVPSSGWRLFHQVSFVLSNSSEEMIHLAEI